MDYRRKLALLRLIPRPFRRAREVKRYVDEINRHGEPELLALREFLKPGMRALDVGCNRGVYAYEMGRLTGNVVAFEPNPALARYVGGLHLPGVRLLQVALSARDGSGELRLPHEVHGWGTLRSDIVFDVGEVSEVATRKLDSLEFDSVDFIKVDVEGLEEEVLEGAVETIARDRPFLLVEIEERHNPGGYRRIAERLRSMEYVPFRLDGSRWREVVEDIATLQDVTAFDAQMASGALFRETSYINNFLFVPQSRKTDINTWHP